MGNDVGGDGAFSAEVGVLGRIRHRYIVRLLGFVSNLLFFDHGGSGARVRLRGEPVACYALRLAPATSPNPASSPKR